MATAKNELEENNQERPAQLPDAFSLFKPSWQAFKLNLSSFVLQLLFPIGLFMLAALIVGIAGQGTSGAITAVAIFAFLVAAIASLVITMSLIVTELHSAEGKRLPFEQAIRLAMHYFWRLLGLLLLSAIIIIIGLLLLIVPGLFAIQRLLLAPYLLISQDIGVMEAVRRSNAIGKNKKYSGAVWGVVGIVIAINLLGIIPWFGWLIGAILSIVYLCAPAIRYVQIRKLEKA